MSYADDFAEMLLDTLTVEGLTPPAIDPNTGVPSGTGTVRAILTQPASDQDVSPSRRFRAEVNNGVFGALPVSICYTNYFVPPTTGPGETLVYRVNGRYRPLMRQGPPQDIAGQHALMELELGAPESSR